MHSGYVIRAASNVWVEGCGRRGPLGVWPRRAGSSQRCNKVLYHKIRRVKVSLATTHAEPAPEPWCLVTNVEGKARKIAGLYRRRMWIDESFRDGRPTVYKW